MAGHLSQLLVKQNLGSMGSTLYSAFAFWISSSYNIHLSGPLQTSIYWNYNHHSVSLDVEGLQCFQFRTVALLKFLNVESYWELFELLWIQPMEWDKTLKAHLDLCSQSPWRETKKMLFHWNLFLLLLRLGFHWELLKISSEET